MNTKPRKRNSPRIAEKSAPQFLQWLRGRSCAFAATDAAGCEGKIEAMHLDFAGGKGMSTKVADSFSIPSCAKHHRAQHTAGWKTFVAMQQISLGDLLIAAGAYWLAWPGRVAWQRKLDAE